MAQKTTAVSSSQVRSREREGDSWTATWIDRHAGRLAGREGNGRGRERNSGGNLSVLAVP